MLTMTVIHIDDIAIDILVDLRRRLAQSIVHLHYVQCAGATETIDIDGCLILKEL